MQILLHHISDIWLLSSICRVSDVRDLNSEVSGSMEDCTGMDGDNGNNQLLEGVAKNSKNLKLVENHENETRVAT